MARPQKRSGQLTSDVIAEGSLDVMASPVSTAVIPGAAGAPTPAPGTSPPVMDEVAMQRARDSEAMGKAWGALSHSARQVGEVHHAKLKKLIKEEADLLVANNMLTAEAIDAGLLDPSENVNVKRGRIRSDAQYVRRDFATKLNRDIDHLRDTDDRFNTLNGTLEYLNVQKAALVEANKPANGEDAEIWNEAFNADWASLVKTVGANQATYIGKRDRALSVAGFENHITDKVQAVADLIREPGESVEDFTTRQQKMLTDSLSIIREGTGSAIGGYMSQFTHTRANEITADALVATMANDPRLAKLAEFAWNNVKTGERRAGAARPLLKETTYAKASYKKNLPAISRNLNAGGLTPSQLFAHSEQATREGVAAILEQQILTGTIDPNSSLTGASAAAAVTEVLKRLEEVRVGQNLVIVPSISGDDPYTIRIKDMSPGLTGKNNTFEINVGDAWKAAKLNGYDGLVNLHLAFDELEYNNAKERVEGGTATFMDEAVVSNKEDKNGNYVAPTPQEAFASASLRLGVMPREIQDRMLTAVNSISHYADEMSEATSGEDGDRVVTEGLARFMDAYEYYHALDSLDPTRASTLFNDMKGGKGVRFLYETFDYLVTNPANPILPKAAYQQILQLKHVDWDETSVNRFEEEFKDQVGALEGDRSVLMFKQKVKDLTYILNAMDPMQDTAGAFTIATKILRKHSSFLGEYRIQHETIGVDNMATFDDLRVMVGGGDASDGFATKALIEGFSDFKGSEEFYSSIPRGKSAEDIVWRLIPDSGGERFVAVCEADDGVPYNLPGPRQDGSFTVSQDFRRMHEWYEKITRPKPKKRSVGDTPIRGLMLGRPDESRQPSGTPKPRKTAREKYDDRISGNIPIRGLGLSPRPAEEWRFPGSGIPIEAVPEQVPLRVFDARTGLEITGLEEELLVPPTPTRSPEPLSPSQITGMSETEVRAALTDVSEALDATYPIDNVDDRDEEVRERLKKEFHLLLDRLKETDRD